MALEANGSDHIETVCNLVRAQRHLVGQYLRGELAQEDVRDVDMETGGGREAEEPEDRVALSAAQRALERCSWRRLTRTKSWPHWALPAQATPRTRFQAPASTRGQRNSTNLAQKSAAKLRKTGATASGDRQSS